MSHTNSLSSRLVQLNLILLLVFGLSLGIPVAGQNKGSTVKKSDQPPGPYIQLPAPPRVIGLPNLTLVEEKLVAYHDCIASNGCYEHDLEGVGGRALSFLKQYMRSARTGKRSPAVVIDIDDTALSNWENMKKMKFAYNHDEFVVWETEAKAPAIKPVFELFQYAHDHGVATVFLTSRAEAERELTIKDLESAGYKDWTKVILRQPDSPKYVADFKSAERHKLKEAGYTIVVNIGDQDSDLAGEVSLGSFKLPNPFYYLR